MIVVAGHLCLDIIPKIQSDTALEPGTLVDTGPADLATGGAVSNVGIALHKLGADVRLVGKIGDDAFGKIVLAQFESFGLARDIQIETGSVTSYTVVVSPPKTDRIFLHCPGCNDSFISADVPDSVLTGASHFHFGYPPLMAAMRADDGLELVSLFQRAKRLGLSTSLDMSLPDKNSDQGKTDWTQLLTNVLPYVDFFMPSEEELAFMLPQVVFGIEELARTCLNLGCAVIVIKRGTDGLFAQSASVGRLDAIAKYSDPNTWSSQRLTQSIFPVEVVGTTGSGDATIAGFLLGLVNGRSFQDCLAIGCAVGAMSVEGVDAVSGIKSWSEACDRF
jgi:sugar/nucleoside kinase (ribokinase family)